MQEQLVAIGCEIALDGEQGLDERNVRAVVRMVCRAAEMADEAVS